MSNMKVVKLADVQSELGVSRWTLYNWLKTGKLQGFKLPSGHYRIPVVELNRLSGREAGDGS